MGLRRARRAWSVAVVMLAAAVGCGEAPSTVSTGQEGPPPPSTALAPPAAVPESGGIVVDIYGQAVAGATVTLWSGPGIQGPFTAVPAGAAVLNPSNRRNPMVTGADGTFNWDMLAGVYKLTATKDGCVSEDGDPEGASSGSFRVPPAFGGFKLILDCRPPDTTNPTLRIDARPPERGASPTVRVAFTVTDNQPLAVAYCLLDDEEPSPTDKGIFGDPCTSPFVRTGLEPGFHRVTIIAMDDHGNMAVETVRFVVG